MYFVHFQDKKILLHIRSHCKIGGFKSSKKGNNDNAYFGDIIFFYLKTKVLASVFSLYITVL